MSGEDVEKALLTIILIALAGVVLGVVLGAFIPKVLYLLHL